MATPNITLTVTLDDFTGAAVAGGALIIALCGYGQTLPKVTGTAMIASVGPTKFTLTSGVSVGIALWGNDQLQPQYEGTPLTYYSIALVDAKNNTIQYGIYQFTGGPLTIDLSNATQLSVAPLQPAASPGVTELNGLEGAITLEAGTGIDISEVGNAILISNTGGGGGSGGVESLNELTGNVQLLAGENINVTTGGGYIEISTSEGGGGGWDSSEILINAAGTYQIPNLGVTSQVAVIDIEANGGFITASTTEPTGFENGQLLTLQITFTAQGLSVQFEEQMYVTSPLTSPASLFQFWQVTFVVINNGFFPIAPPALYR
jgi:hypothetical protein